MSIGRIALSWTYFTKDLDYLLVQGTKGTLRVGWNESAVRAAWRAGTGLRSGQAIKKQDAFGSQLSALLSRISRIRDAVTPAELTGALDFVERIYEVERFGRSVTSGDSWATFSRLTPR